MNKLLPIGSIVLLKNSNKRLMIIGRVQKVAGETDIWDYSGCYYPEGNINPEKNYLFNHDQIERVYFMGYQDEDEIKFEAYLGESLEKLRSEQ